MTHSLTERQAELVDFLPAASDEIKDELGLTKSSFQSLRERITDKDGWELEYHYDGPSVIWEVTNRPDPDPDDTDLPDLSDVEQGEDPDPDDLTDRERYVVREAQTGTNVAELADELGARETVVTQHLRDLKREGWPVYFDGQAEMVVIEGDHDLRSSEHKGTRTRKANRWWELRHNQLVREFRSLDRPTSDVAASPGSEDWILHLTDLHAGDRVRRDDGTIVYETDTLPDVIDHITDRSLSLADKHGSDYDTAHLLWGGDFVTNEGIYEGQFEDLDAWLDEQHDTLVDPLLRQLKTHSKRFPSVQVVCQVGNHGKHRASGTSRQANADLILYKHLRNTVAAIREHSDVLDNVEFVIGEAKPYRNFELRGGSLRGHLRHGQHRRPQAETSARKKEWLSTLMDHDFDIAVMGHHHISGRIPWGGPPVICTASPKPAGEFVEQLGERTPNDHQGLATAFGVSDDGLTATFPIDTRHYQT